jgi:hypothetical protein
MVLALGMSPLTETPGQGCIPPADALDLYPQLAGARWRENIG